MIIDSNRETYDSAMSFLLTKEWFNKIGMIVDFANDDLFKREFISTKLENKDNYEIVELVVDYWLDRGMCDEEIISFFLTRDKDNYILDYANDIFIVSKLIMENK